MRKLPSCCFALMMLLTATRGSAQDENPFLYTEILPVSSGLPFDPATDVQESFTAPNGKTVEVLVRGPRGDETYSRAMRADGPPLIVFPEY